MREVILAFFRRVGIPLAQQSRYRFTIDGERIQPNLTAEHYDLDDGHMIDVDLEMSK